MESHVPQAVAESVRTLQPDIVDALQQLVRIPSQTGFEGQAQDAMASLMRRHGLEVDVWEPDPAVLEPHSESITVGSGFANRPNVVGACRGRGNGRSLILNGHIDTVAVGDPTAWNFSGLGGETADGRLYGRGACDMKGGLVANLFALRALRHAGLTPAADVFVQSTIAEEDGGAGALAAVLRGYVADGALISEPTNLAIVPAQGGSLMFRLQVPGLSAHACVRDDGVSAVEKFAYIHRGLLDFEARRNADITHPLYAGMRNKVPINIGTVNAGSWPSSVPELLVAEGRAGLVPGEDLTTFKAELAAEVAALAAADDWLRNHPPLVTWLDGQFAPAGISVDSPLVTVLTTAWMMTTSSHPRIEAVTYGADMRHFVITGGMPCVMFGAGDVRLAHAPNELIPLGDLFTAITTTAVFIAEWCGLA
ncbi:MAG: ArgE/DapE family deacylase [Chloroflexi bacterium]|nr:ArgE/DapE family deacylase [Chloroflexota bacterium]